MEHIHLERIEDPFEPSPDLLALWARCQVLAAEHREWIHNRAAELTITEAAFVQLLDDVADCDVADVTAKIEALGLTMDQFVDRVADIVDRAEPFGYLAEDPTLYVEPSAPFDPTWSRPRMSTGRGTEVRGRRDGYVIGDTNRAAGDAAPAHHGDYVRMPYREALERANAWHYMATGETLPLIGTDEFSWEEVVTFRPVAFRMVDGSMVAMRPDGAGDSIVGSVNRRPSNSHNPRPGYNGSAVVYTVNRDGKKRRTTVRLKVPRPEVTTYNGWWPRADVRVVKQYRTTYAGRYCIGHGSWIDRPATVRKNRAAVAKPRRRVPVVDVAAFDTDTVTAMVEQMARSFRTADDATVKVRDTNGTTVTMQHEPSHRRFRVTVANDNGRSMTTVRTLSAVVDRVAAAVNVDRSTITY